MEIAFGGAMAAIGAAGTDWAVTERPRGFSALAKLQLHGIMPTTERLAQTRASAGVRSASKTSGRRKRLIWQRS